MFATITAAIYGLALAGLIGTKVVQIGLALCGAASTEPFATALLVIWLALGAVLTSGFWLLPLALRCRALAGARVVCVLTHASLASIFVLILGLELKELLSHGLPSLHACVVGVSGCAVTGFVLYRLFAAEADALCDGSRKGFC